MLKAKSKTLADIEPAGEHKGDQVLDRVQDQGLDQELSRPGLWLDPGLSRLGLWLDPGLSRLGL